MEEERIVEKERRKRLVYEGHPHSLSLSFSLTAHLIPTRSSSGSRDKSGLVGLSSIEGGHAVASSIPHDSRDFGTVRKASGLSDYQTDQPYCFMIASKGLLLLLLSLSYRVM